MSDPADDVVPTELVASPAASCSWCGTQAAEVPATWSCQTSERGRGVEWLCTACTRSNLRSIEGQLGADWW